MNKQQMLGDALSVGGNKNNTKPKKPQPLPIPKRTSSDPAAMKAWRKQMDKYRRRQQEILNWQRKYGQQASAKKPASKQSLMAAML